MATDPKVDAYIAKAQPFAQPILMRIRTVVHKACKNLEEKIKWGFPHFDYNGKMMCSMAAFKQHCALNFWLGADIKSLQPFVKTSDDERGMGQLGRITSIKDLPSEKELIKIISEAMELSDKGTVLKRADPAKVAELPLPDDFKKLLAKNKKAKEVFEKFPPSHRKEYLQWIIEAKTDETRQRRMVTALEWIAEGKGRNWKYEKK